ncbi:MAG: hypothetical protein LBU40_06395, partial [Methanobrevibacter sp.]|nr:hypothetical protein [Methanobrevibacter sp.]
EEEFKNAMDEHVKILKILGFYLKPIYNQTFVDESNNLPRANKKLKSECNIFLHFTTLKLLKILLGV